MDAIIDKKKSAFSKNKLISNHTLINHEVIRSLKLR